MRWKLNIKRNYSSKTFRSASGCEFINSRPDRGVALMTSPLFLRTFNWFNEEIHLLPRVFRLPFSQPHLTLTSSVHSSSDVRGNYFQLCTVELISLVCRRINFELSMAESGWRKLQNRFLACAKKSHQIFLNFSKAELSARLHSTLDLNFKFSNVNNERKKVWVSKEICQEGELLRERVVNKYGFARRSVYSHK